MHFCKNKFYTNLIHSLKETIYLSRFIFCWNPSLSCCCCCNERISFSTRLVVSDSYFSCQRFSMTTGNMTHYLRYTQRSRAESFWRPCLLYDGTSTSFLDIVSAVNNTCPLWDTYARCTAHLGKTWIQLEAMLHQ